MKKAAKRVGCGIVIGIVVILIVVLVVVNHILANNLGELINTKVSPEIKKAMVDRKV